MLDFSRILPSPVYINAPPSSQDVDPYHILKPSTLPHTKTSQLKHPSSYRGRPNTHTVLSHSTTYLHSTTQHLHNTHPIYNRAPLTTKTPSHTPTKWLVVVPPDATSLPFVGFVGRLYSRLLGVSTIKIKRCTLVVSLLNAK
jgi:hypothetical protein